MTYLKDNIDVFIPMLHGREFDLRLKEYETWLRERNIKYTVVYLPLWDTVPSAINLRNEDAIIFKMVFGI